MTTIHDPISPAGARWRHSAGSIARWRQVLRDDGEHRERHGEAGLVEPRRRWSRRTGRRPRGRARRSRRGRRPGSASRSSRPGAGSTSGSQRVQTCVAEVSATTSRPAARTSAPNRRPTCDGRFRSDRTASRTTAATSASPTSICSVDQSVSMSASRPPGRRTRAISATAAAGSASHCKVRSDRTASNASARLVQRHRVADGEANGTRGVARTLAGDREHRRARVDADDLAGRAEIGGERDGRVTQPTPHVEEPFALRAARGGPVPTRAARRMASQPEVASMVATWNGDVRLVVDPLVAQSVRILRGARPDGTDRSPMSSTWSPVLHDNTSRWIGRSDDRAEHGPRPRAIVEQTRQLAEAAAVAGPDAAVPTAGVTVTRAGQHVGQTEHWIAEIIERPVTDPDPAAHGDGRAPR